MIRGNKIADLMRIKDTTPGPVYIWIMIIMLLGIYIIYQCIYIFWTAKRAERLKYYQKLLKNGPEAIHNTVSKGSQSEKQNNKNDYKAAGYRVREYNNYSMEDEEHAREVLNNLRKR